MRWRRHMCLCGLTPTPYFSLSLLPFFVGAMKTHHNPFRVPSSSHHPCYPCPWWDVLKRKGIIEYPELEEIHKKHLDQTQAPPRISQRREGGNHLTALGPTSVPSAPCQPKRCCPLVLLELESQFRVQPGEPHSTLLGVEH